MISARSFPKIPVRRYEHPVRHFTVLGHNLLALASGEKHGYEIMKQVKHDSHGQVKMGSGTLYGSIKRMLAAQLIEEAGEKPDPTFDQERRRYYRLTDVGRRAFNTELQRYSEVVSLAQQRSLLPHFSGKPSL